jgi:hypothetical protein
VLTRQVPAVQPLRVMQTPTDWVGAPAAPPYDNLDGTVGLHKSSAYNKVVHMEHSLRLSFQLSCSLGDYMMGTIAEFRLTTMEALAP